MVNTVRELKWSIYSCLEVSARINPGERESDVFPLRRLARVLKTRRVSCLSQNIRILGGTERDRMSLSRVQLVPYSEIEKVRSDSGVTVETRGGVSPGHEFKVVYTFVQSETPRSHKGVSV